MSETSEQEWLSFNQELSRKTATSVNHWVAAHNSGVITKRELFICLTGIYDSVSGLIDKDLMDLIADILKDLKNGNL